MVDASPRRVPLPSLAQHLREFAARRDAWLILARNLVPVVGIYVFRWSADLAVFSYWFDGLSALAAIMAAMTPRAMRETQSKGTTLGAGIKHAMTGVFVWILLVVFVGLPYWIVLVPLNELLLGEDLRRQITHSPGLWLTFAALAGGHFWKAFHAGYDALPEKELKQRVRWDVYLLMLRGIAMFFMASPGLAMFLVPVMALLLAYFEIWPERVLAATFGDPTRLWEYDPEEGTRRRR
ncbi:MAG TPA: DUF6498-containing protein [Rudaea sp.]|nr:DUF6498-containing protein [Rudaea sp.]